MKNLDYFNKLEADKLKMDLAVVKAVNRFFWKKGVKANMSGVKIRSIFIKNLGTFTVSKYKLYKEIGNTIQKIRMMKKSTKFTEEKKKMIITFLYESLSQMLRQRNIIATDFYNERNHE